MKPSDHRVLFNAGCNFLFAADYRPVEDRPGRLRWRYIRVTKSRGHRVNRVHEMKWVFAFGYDSRKSSNPPE